MILQNPEISKFWNLKRHTNSMTPEIGQIFAKVAWLSCPFFKSERNWTGNHERKWASCFVAAFAAFSTRMHLFWSEMSNLSAPFTFGSFCCFHWSSPWPFGNTEGALFKLRHMRLDIAGVVWRLASCKVHWRMNIFCDPQDESSPMPKKRNKTSSGPSCLQLQPPALSLWLRYHFLCWKLEDKQIRSIKYEIKQQSFKFMSRF